MINFQINAIGKLKKSPVLEIISDYKKRISNNLVIREFEARKSQNIPLDVVKDSESKFLLSYIPKNSCLISMDEGGQLFSSKNFADLIQEKTIKSISSFVFFIGGSAGLHENVIKVSDHTISLGKITLPHMLARLVLVEQIYRIEKILGNHPYDK